MKRFLVAICLAFSLSAHAGLPCAGCQEAATTVQTGTFGSTTTSTPVLLYGPINVSFWGTFSASTTIQRSFDGGVTWINVAQDTSGTVATYTTAITLVLNEPESAVFYRLSCTYVSGTVNYRFSGGTPRNP